ncbi:putative membrane protein [Salsuginibacillus halophilus]|uniref:Putative membrane protein n=1 Tax=Salsuginibacillus halophilus TaxID=517424 RepID=A0A2P8H958_9BACI|nr:small multi-drug export protein [Salsuginibacillus halophilus]PSL42720.1 putative membrane protein [Salsuginibacillus halophilus]
MWEYVSLSISAFFMGYVPFFEIYLAIPVVMIAGMDPVSAIIWSGMGNFLAVPTVLFLYQLLSRWPRLGRWMKKLEYNRFRRHIDRYGGWMVLLVTVLVGVWAVAAAGRSLGMSYRVIMISSACSIILYGIATAFAVQRGLDFF